ncbi:hypothetical protein B0H16DRAFT_144774 [Mycena metata]|uniref:Uncharacterized protein n=1 Tax=Mycena metata TaxID=1033252 RepID=A0AAD7JYR9_9AGAR|nr:hypothetical protein B0H16DRAFT_144774 [Mycena metata]
MVRREIDGPARRIKMLRDTNPYHVFPRPMDAQGQLLPQFTWVATSLYKNLYEDLWPAPDGSSVAALDDRIEFLTPDDQWLTLSTDSEAMDVDNQAGEGDGDREGRGHLNDELDEDPTSIGFIPLKTYPALEIGPLSRLVMDRGDDTVFFIRPDYDVFLEHARSRVRKAPSLNSPTRFFVTGQPGIGKTFGCYYFLFRLLASGQSVFFLRSRTETLYFSGDGVQRNDRSTGPSECRSTGLAIQKSWVLIDVDDQAEWSCPEIFATARCIVWTSSPREPRMRNFVKRFGAERWYMKTWSSKEIAAVTERSKIDRSEILRRMDTGGPVARSLFPLALPHVTAQTLRRNINNALSTNIFNFKPFNDDVIRIEPLVVIDPSGRARLQRTDYSIEFLSAFIAEKTLDVAQNMFPELQKQLAATFDIETTRTLAGKVVEALMHRALKRGMELPKVFGPNRTIARTLALIGKAESFVRETAAADIAAQRPLYLRPKSQNFAAVDAILVTENTLSLIQTSLNDGHSRNFGTILRITSRLAGGAGVRVNSSWEVLYCLVGTTPNRVTRLVAGAKKTLVELQKLNAEDLCTQLSIPFAQVAHDRISKLRVVGYTFHSVQGFEEVA